MLAAAGALALAVAFPAGAAAKPCEPYADLIPALITAEQARSAVVCLINHKRSNRDRPKLDGDGRLHEAARNHSSHMEANDCFSHKCVGEPGLLKRLRKVRYIVDGLSRWAYGENIAWGEATRGSPREVVEAWMRSSGHRQNILSRTFRDVGVGFAREGITGLYTADFGLRVG